MARTPTLRLAILLEVERAVTAMPRGAQLACLARLEQLPPDLDPSQSYPRDWIAFRALGTNALPPPPRASRQTEAAHGAAILADLSPLVERLSAALELDVRDIDSGAYLSLAQVQERWGCSATTLQRWRRQGLVWRRVRGWRDAEASEKARPTRLVTSRMLVAWIERTDPHVRERAAKFARVDPGVRERMVRRALRYHASLGWSLHRCARRLAERFDHSVEGVRQLLRRDPRARVAFPSKRKITPRRRRAMLRMSRLGVDVVRLAELAQRSPAIVRRELALARAESLRRLFPLLALGEAPSVEELPRVVSEGLDPLAPLSVRRGLRTPWAMDLRQLIDEWRARRASTNVEERERAAAFQLLRARAHRAIARLDRLHPRTGELDRIETDLRWADALLRELVRSQHRLILETIEQRAGTSAEQLAGPRLLEVLQASVVAAGEAAARFDPTSGGRLAGATALPVDRAVTRLVRNWLPAPLTASRRAASVLVAGVKIPDLATLVTPWERWTRVDPRVERAVLGGGIDEQAAKLLTLRFGLAGGAPRTLEELQQDVSLDAIRVAHAEAAAIRQALAWVRGEYAGT
jgi:hypothetical protein